MAGRLPVLLGTFTAKETKEFYKRASSIVHSLNTRMRKDGTAGRLELNAGRDLLLAGVNGPCRYCKRIIKIKTMSLDHPVPLARGGDPWTLEVICDECNRIKGGALEPEIFLDFTTHLKTYPEYAENYIRGMMKAGAAYPRLLLMIRRGKQGNQAGAPAEEGSLLAVD